MSVPGDSLHRANRFPIMTAEAPAVKAIATSPGVLIPPSAMTGMSAPYFATASDTCAVANRVGEPAFVISVVVQIDPDPMPTLNQHICSSSVMASSAASYVPILPTLTSAETSDINDSVALKPL